MSRSQVQLAFVILFVLAGLYFFQQKPPTSTAEVVTAEPLHETPEVVLREVAQESPEVASTENEIRPVVMTAEVALVDEILKSKNDNDPRLDNELRYLDDNAKTALRSYYLSRPEEDRNGKGTVLFLLGRNIKGPEDVQFLAEALRESPCRSLADCSKEPEVMDHHESQHDAAPETTLAYPKMVVLSTFERELKNEALSPEARAQMMSSIAQTTKSPEPAVAKRASRILDSYKR